MQKEASVEMTVMFGAHHEAGHIVIAAVLGLTLRPDGLMVEANGNGLAVYATWPEESDDSRERIILATFAGFWASERFCVERSCPEILDSMKELSPDWKYARMEVIPKLSVAYMAGENPHSPQLRLEQKSRRLVEEHWLTIKALADALLAKNPEPMKPLKDGTPWSPNSGPVRYMDGEEAVEVLARHRIVAACKPRANTEGCDILNS